MRARDSKVDKKVSVFPGQIKFSLRILGALFSTHIHTCLDTYLAFLSHLLQINIGFDFHRSYVIPVIEVIPI